MNNKAVISLLLLVLLFNGCTQHNPLPAKIMLQNQKEIGNTKLPRKKSIIGSVQYVDEVSQIAKREGYKTALDRIVNDVEKNSEGIEKNDTENNLRLYKLISSFVSEIGYVDMRMHYFRNKLNKAPQSLKELLYLNSKLPSGKHWKLISGENSLYHMQGNGGEYNLKFVSCEGFCEAVYNKNGILLTEKNDPVNMGTFNYCAGIKESNAHTKFDIEPYLKWGNTLNSTQKSKDDIRKGVELAGKNYKQNKSKVLEYRKKIINITGVHFLTHKLYFLAEIKI